MTNNDDPTQEQLTMAVLSTKLEALADKVDGMIGMLRSDVAKVERKLDNGIGMVVTELRADVRWLKKAHAGAMTVVAATLIAVITLCVEVFMKQ